MTEEQQTEKVGDGEGHDHIEEPHCFNIHEISCAFITLFCTLSSYYIYVCCVMTYRGRKAKSCSSGRDLQDASNTNY